MASNPNITTSFPKQDTISLCGFLTSCPDLVVHESHKSKYLTKKQTVVESWDDHLELRLSAFYFVSVNTTLFILQKAWSWQYFCFTPCFIMFGWIHNLSLVSSGGSSLQWFSCLYRNRLVPFFLLSTQFMNSCLWSIIKPFYFWTLALYQVITNLMSLLKDCFYCSPEDIQKLSVVNHCKNKNQMSLYMMNI